MKMSQEVKQKEEADVRTCRKVDMLLWLYERNNNIEEIHRYNHSIVHSGHSTRFFLSSGSSRCGVTARLCLLLRDVVSQT